MKKKVQTNPSNDIYFIVDEENEIIIKIKALTKEEFNTYIAEVVEKVKKEEIRTIAEYVEEICSKLIVGVPKTASAYSKFKKKFFTPAVFGEIVEIYEPLYFDTIAKMANLGTQTKINNLARQPAAKKEEEVILSKKDVAFFTELNTNLKSNVLGQDDAIDSLLNLLKVKATGLTDFLSMLFIGPTGCGKTETAKLIAKYYFKDESKTIKINCGEYANNHEQNKLLGSPPGYMGSDDKSLLLELAEKSNEYVFIIDEIEKASERLRELLLGILDDGTIVDNRGRTLDFSKSLFIFTSNAGVKDLYEHNRNKIGFPAIQNSVDANLFLEEELKKEFTPEFLNRIDRVVYYSSLSKESCLKIAALHLTKLLPKTFVVDDKLAQFVVDNAFSKEYGARNIRRYIKNFICLKLADKILIDGEIKNEGFYEPIYDTAGLLTEIGFKTQAAIH